MFRNAARIDPSPARLPRIICNGFRQGQIGHCQRSRIAGPQNGQRRQSQIDGIVAGALEPCHDGNGLPIPAALRCPERRMIARFINGGDGLAETALLRIARRFCKAGFEKLAQSIALRIGL